MNKFIFFCAFFGILNACAQVDPNSKLVKDFVQCYNYGNDDIDRFIYDTSVLKVNDLLKQRYLYWNVELLSFEGYVGDTALYKYRMEEGGDTRIMKFCFKEGKVSYFSFPINREDAIRGFLFNLRLGRDSFAKQHFVEDTMAKQHFVEDTMAKQFFSAMSIAGKFFIKGKYKDLPYTYRSGFTNTDIDFIATFAFSDDKDSLLIKGIRVEMVIPDLQKQLLVKEMKEDADLFFKKLYELHPNPYFYCSKDVFEKKKNSIYASFTKPMSVQNFLLNLAKINSCLDLHSHLYLPGILNENTKFPPVIVEKSEVYILYKGENRVIKEVNGVPMQKVIDFYNQYDNHKLPKERMEYVSEIAFSGILEYLVIEYPYTITFADNTKEIIEYTKEEQTFVPYSFEIYLESSTAIFNANTFSRNLKNELENKLNIFRDSIDKCNVKNVFINVANNTGGTHPPKIIYDLINHDSLSLIHVHGNITSKPYINKIPRKLFVLQSTGTFSGADYFCRDIRNNKLGVLIGQNSGADTEEFTGVYTATLPNSGMLFKISTIFLDFSDTCPTPSLEPDMYWDTNHKYIYTEKDLLDILKAWNKQTNK